MPPIRVGVVGVGYVGALHAQVYRKLPRLATLVAVCDVNRARAEEVAGRLGCRAAGDVRDLLGEVEAVSVCVPTNRHHAVGMGLLEAGVHVLMEKPIATTLAEADALLMAARRSRCTFQVGHIERFNAAIQTAQEYLTHPRFIEAHRLSSYPFRGTDVSVVLDVMIHDLDLVLSLVTSQPVRIDAIGVPVLSRTEDIANARLVFPSGCVANLTASRVSDESIRRIRLFQEDGYLSIDYKQQTAELARVSPRRFAPRSGTGGGKDGAAIQRTLSNAARRWMSSSAPSSTPSGPRSARSCPAKKPATPWPSPSRSSAPCVGNPQDGVS
ncbi:MAG: Gfo/Idh/MocA family oxidoreductase [Candidatus Omnitrophica bacterium]|nr:Gfo/Idh/MocA family oxidoreductase [Candidatus Omnitrophota bacterium]